MRASQRVAVIDVGTNSVRLLLAEIFDDGAVRTLSRVGAVTRLGEGVGRGGAINAEAESRTTDAARGFAEGAKAEGARSVVITGTSALRRAANGREVAQRMSATIGHDVTILSGVEEARLVFSAVGGAHSGPRVVVDIGGGSTEITAGDGASVEWALSADLGVVTLTEMFPPGNPPDAEQRERLAQHVDSELPLAHLHEPHGGAAFYGVGGTFTALATMNKRLSRYSPAAIDGHLLRREDVARLSDRLWRLSGEERRRLPGVDVGRADVVLAGTVVLSAILRQTEAGGIVVSTKGLRYGVLADWVQREASTISVPLRFIP